MTELRRRIAHWIYKDPMSKPRIMRSEDGVIYYYVEQQPGQTYIIAEKDDKEITRYSISTAEMIEWDESYFTVKES